MWLIILKAVIIILVYMFIMALVLDAVKDLHWSVALVFSLTISIIYLFATYIYICMSYSIPLFWV